jgi:hypothetical protein
MGARLAASAIASTGGPCASSFLDQHAEAVASRVGDLFHRGPGGWDVHPIRLEG